MAIWFVLLVIALATVALMVIPLWRRTESARSRAAFDAQVYRDQLEELEIDAARERITSDQAASARTEIARRLLAATSNQTPSEENTGLLSPEAVQAESHAARRGIAVFVALAVPIAAFGVYLIIGSPHLLGRPAAEVKAQVPAAGSSAEEAAQAQGAALVARLGEKLKDRPDDLKGWTLYAQSLARLGQFDKAVQAYGRVTALAPRDAEIMSRLAEAQIFAAKGTVTPAARKTVEATLALDASEPRARYYLGLAESQVGKFNSALSIWIALEADFGPDAPWSAILAERIRKIAARGNITAEQLATRRKAAAEASKAMPRPIEQATPQPGGPSAADVKAAQSMPREERMAMIRGMVAGLADRLKSQPDDIQGWQRLARSYEVLGETKKAREAYGQIARLQPNDVDALAAYASAIGRTMAKDDPITPELLALGNRILALDPNHTGALWFTGMALAEVGDKTAARKRWTHLLTKLDPSSPQYADVVKSIEALDR